MMCEKCGKNLATTHIKKVINGSVEEHSLCSFCAAEQGYGGMEDFSLSNMLSMMLGGHPKGVSVSKKRCTVCGSTFSDIAKSGRVGCGECYETFKEELLPSLQRLHGRVKHIGKTPESEVKEQTLEEKIIKLKEKLTDAVQNEEFEKAAEIRDEIKSLERENG